MFKIKHNCGKKAKRVRKETRSDEKVKAIVKSQENMQRYKMEVNCATALSLLSCQESKCSNPEAGRQ